MFTMRNISFVLTPYSINVNILNLNFVHTLQRGQTPFMLAVARGKPQIVNDLWTYKDKFDINVTDIVSFLK